uniref:Uncharacterized protein n=1 Tax=Arundo donax TaxID=35708 RepID=A0A0A9DAD1_ARUDO
MANQSGIRTDEQFGGSIRPLLGEIDLRSSGTSELGRALLVRLQGVAPTDQCVVIKNETAGIDWTSPKVLDVEIERLHDTSREKNSGAGWPFLGFGRGAGLAGDEHAGAGALTLDAGRGEEHGAHAGRRRRSLLLRLLKRGERGRVEAKWRTKAGGLLSTALVRAPRRRCRRGELPLLLEVLMLLQGMKTSRLNLLLELIPRIAVDADGLGIRTRRRWLPRQRHDGVTLMGSRVLGHGDAVRAEAGHLPGRRVQQVPGISRRLLQWRRRRRADLRRHAVGAVLPRSRQPAQRGLRRTGHQLRLWRRVLSVAVATEEARHAAREPAEPFLLVALALGRDRRLLLLGKEVVIQELIREPELRVGEGALLRHSAQENTPLHAWSGRPRT